MGFISWFTIRIIGITKLAGKRRRERKELRKIEKEAYMQHKNIKEDIKWEDAKRKAVQRGIERANATPAEKLRSSVKARKEKNMSEIKESKPIDKSFGVNNIVTTKAKPTLVINTKKLDPSIIMTKKK